MAMSASTCGVASSAASMASYEVFISHRGLEMKMGLANHLHHALKIGGIKSFLDVEELPPGEDVRRHMLEAARTSVIGVPIFTEMYGSSEWCLDELVGMIDNQHSRGGKVIPVFYNVQPEDLRMNWDGPFAGHFEDFVKKLRHPDEERIKRWKSALQAASWLAGYRLNDYGGYVSFMLLHLGFLLRSVFASGAELISSPCRKFKRRTCLSRKLGLIDRY